MISTFTFYHVEAKGAADKHVTCEHCAREFSYRVERRAKLDSVPLAPLERQADAIVQDRVAKALQIGVEAVSCPFCAWVQAHMVDELRRRFASPVRTVGIFMAIACAGIALLAIAMGTFMEGDFDATGMTLASIAGCGVCLLALPLRRLLGRLRYRREGGFKSRKPISAHLLVPTTPTSRPIAA